MEPPPSLPVASATMPEARAAAVPPEDPPGERSGSQGLRVGPYARLVVSPWYPYSGVAVLPSTTHPAARNRATRGESSAAGGSSDAAASRSRW